MSKAFLKTTNLVNFIILVSVGMLVAGCTTISTSKRASLFDRLGGFATLNLVVDETIDEVSANPKTKRSFEGIKLATLKKSVVQQLCYLSNGPCNYEGDNMKNAHADHKITQAEFELFVATFRESLNKHVDTAEKNELLRLLAPMRRDIVAQ